MKLTHADHIQGSPSAPIILVEYADYQCSYCGKAYPIIKNLQKKFGHKLAFVFRNFPLTDIHPFALDAAIAAEAAGKQGKFWEMHDMIFENQRHLDSGSLVRYAGMIGLDTDAFENLLNDKSILGKIEADFKSGGNAGVEGTPSFFINGRFFDGNWTTPELEEYIESLL